MHRLLHGYRNGQRLRLSQPDILGGQNNQTPSDKQRVFSGMNHAGQPVERSVRRGAAHRFDKRGDGVVVAIPGLVIQRRAALQSVGNDLLSNRAAAFFLRRSRLI